MLLGDFTGFLVLYLSLKTLKTLNSTKMACKRVSLLCVLLMLTCAAAQTMITNCVELENIENDLAGDYVLANLIDCSDTVNWNAGAGFSPVGANTLPFTGTFDGQGYVIYDLFLNWPGAANIGMFGYTGASAQVMNVGLERGSVTAYSFAGALVGYNEGLVTNSYSTLSVSGGNVNIGGLVGYNTGTISTSYATGAISGTGNIGGLVGNNQLGTITNSYSIGSVPATGNHGGLLGWNNGGSITGSYWDTDTSGLAVGHGGTGKTTVEMGQQATYVGWNFTDTWWICQGYPQLRALTPPTSTLTNPAISDCTTLQEMCWHQSYYLTGDIDCSDTVNWNGGLGFNPIGTGATFFDGTLDGRGYVIYDLYLNYPGNAYIALFTRLGASAQVMNLGLERGSVTAQDNVGALAGRNDGVISNCYSTLSVSGGGVNVGGLVGSLWMGASIIDSYATGAVTTPSNYVGGLVGASNALIERSYATGSVSGALYVGGLVGLSGGSSTVTNCYATGDVSVSSSDGGGLVGLSQSVNLISLSYSTGLVSGSSTNVGGLVGQNTGTVTDCYWDTQTSGQSSSAGGTGKTSSEMQQQTTYVAWNFTGIWSICQGYPQLTTIAASPPAQGNISISDCATLQSMCLHLNYYLTEDIDCSDTVNWNSGAGFEPLGWYVSESNRLPFTGTFDGQGYAIYNLTINRPTSGNIGLFGHVGQSSTVSNVGLINVNVNAKDYVGALVGDNRGAAMRCYASGTVSGVGASTTVGGLIGYNEGDVTKSFATTTVSGDDRVGGLLGQNLGNLIQSYATGSVSAVGTNAGGLVGRNSGGSMTTQSYATGTVSGDTRVGGLIGHNSGSASNSYSIGSVSGTSNLGGLAGSNSGSITSSYWDTQTSGQASSAGGASKTTAEMYQEATFISWDFTAVWWITEGSDYPQLRVFSSINVVNPISDKVNAIGDLFSFVVPTDTFEDATDPVLDYFAQLLGGSSLPGWLTFTTGTRTFSGTPLSGAQGTYNIEVIATNNNTESASDVFVLTVTNRDPTLDNALINQAVGVGATLNYAFAANTFSDGDSDPLSYTAELSGGGSLPPWLSFTSGTRTFSGLPASGEQGVLNIEVTASDGFDGTVMGAFSITVNNQDPTVQIPIVTVYATNGQLLQWMVPAGTFNDVDGDSLILSAASNGGGSLPGWLSFNSSTATLSGTPTSRGSYALQVTADDGFGGQVTDPFDLVIPNTPPVVANAFPNQDVDLNVPFSFSLPGNTFFDQDGDGLTYSASLQNTSALPGWMSFTPGTLTFSGMATLRESYEIAVNADDGAGGNVTLLFSLRVANQAPTVQNTISAQNAPIGTLFQFAFAANTFNDDDGDVLTYTAMLNGGGSLPAWLSLTSSTRTFSGTPVSGSQATLSITVTADDGFGGQSSTSFSLTVSNTDPVLDTAISDQRFNANEAFSWTVPNTTFADADSDPFTYTAELQGGGSLPGWLAFDGNTGTLSGTIPSSQSTPLMITITADDGFGGQVSDTFELSVNLVPTLNGFIDNQQATVGNPFLYTFPANLFNEPDGDPLIYSATKTDDAPLPAWLTLNGNTRTFLGTPSASDRGFLFVLLIASDPHGGSVSVSFGIAISDLTGNNPPLLAVSILDQTASNGEQWSFSVPANTFDDPDSDPLTYVATLEGGASLPTWLTFDDQSRVFSGIPTTAEVIRLTVRVDDGRGGFALDTFTLTIQDTTNQPPALLNQLPNQNAKVDSRFSYTVPVGTFTDPNGDVLTYTAIQAGDKPLPGWLSFDAASRTFSGKPSDTDTETYGDRTHTIQVCASDGEGSACSSFLLTVSGASQAETAITAVIALVSVASTLYGAYAKRAWLWNHLMKSRYQKSSQHIVMGEQYYQEVSYNPADIDKLQVIHNGRVLSEKPTWLSYGKTPHHFLQGTPPISDLSVGVYQLCLVRFNGCIAESHRLQVKKNAADPDDDGIGLLGKLGKWLSRDTGARDAGDIEMVDVPLRKKGAAGDH